jgi:hypothetical protein
MMENEEKPIFVTDDKSIREGGAFAKADTDILESIRKGEGFIAIESPEQLQEIAKAAAERFEEFRELCRPMKRRQAKIIRKLRVKKRYTWRAIAQACFNFGWGKWSPPSNQLMGMALCEKAAKFFNENYMEPPWN